MVEKIIIIAIMAAITVAVFFMLRVPIMAIGDEIVRVLQVVIDFVTTLVP